MIGTLTAFQWLIYDSFKVYLGVSLSLYLSLACYRLFLAIFIHCYEIFVTDKHYSSPRPAVTSRIELHDTRGQDSTREDHLPVRYRQNLEQDEPASRFYGRPEVPVRHFITLPTARRLARGSTGDVWKETSRQDFEVRKPEERTASNEERRVAFYIYLEALNSNKRRTSLMYRFSYSHVDGMASFKRRVRDCVDSHTQLKPQDSDCTCVTALATGQQDSYCSCVPWYITSFFFFPPLLPLPSQFKDRDSEDQHETATRFVFVYMCVCVSLSLCMY
jgi:hypothetical protein